LGCSWELIHSFDEKEHHNIPIIYYTNKSENNKFTIIPFNNLLNTIEITPIAIIPELIDQTLAFFINNDSVLNFDIFAASFYLVSRYEEYLPHKLDSHNRFAATESLAYKFNFLDRPLINEWVKLLAKKLLINYPNLTLKHTDYKHIVTVDIDSVYSYRHKGLKRCLGGFFRDMMHVNLKNIVDRLLTISHLKADPYDVYQQIYTLASANSKKIKWFILAANYAAPDNSNLLHNKAIQAKIKLLYKMGEIGVHPSYLSNKKSELITEEINYLHKLTSSNIKISRQHFLMLSFPSTYQNLIKNGITEDYTMGYADKAGFRASIASPFFFFDLSANKVTSLRIFPLVMMDRTFVSYEKLSYESTLLEINKLRNTVKENNGTLVSLWHNITLANTKEGRQWMRVLKTFLESDSA